jgi:hypothetical protein
MAVICLQPCRAPAAHRQRPFRPTQARVSARRGVRDGQDDGLRRGGAPRARGPLAAASPGDGGACSPIDHVAELEERDGARPAAVACRGQVGVKGCGHPGRGRPSVQMPDSCRELTSVRWSPNPQPGSQGCPCHQETSGDLGRYRRWRGCTDTGETEHRGCGLARNCASALNHSAATDVTWCLVVSAGHISTNRHQPDAVA